MYVYYITFEPKISLLLFVDVVIIQRQLIYKIHDGREVILDLVSVVDFGYILKRNRIE